MTKEAKTYNGIKMVYSMNGAGKIGQTLAKKKKNDTIPPPYNIHRNKSITKIAFHL